MSKKILTIISPTGFKDEEYYEPKTVWENSGLQVVTCRTVPEAISTNDQKQKVDVLLQDAGTDYDAIAFIGGPGAPVYFDDPKAHELARKFYDQGKIVSAICIAPVILAKAGLLRNKKATVYPSGEQDIKNGGAEYTGEDVTQDGKIITANGPRAAKKFGETLLKVLA